jgi:predicted adenine nucleotide alpha hydrolase (AANH) superfamily ATPase
MAKEQILLHACCATCAGYVLEKLAPDYTPLLYYFNPNIFPPEEYNLRRDELKSYADKKKIEFIEENYDPDSWLQVVKGLEHEPEKGRRCDLCFYYRLQQTASFAQKNDIRHFTTTLTISPHKKSKTILDIGREIADQQGLTFLAEDFKKKDGFLKTMAMAKKEGFYRQNYCGCVFSRKKLHFGES